MAKRSKASIARQYAVKDRRYAHQVASGQWPSDSCPACLTNHGACCQRTWHHAGDVCLHCGLNEKSGGMKFRKNGTLMLVGQLNAPKGARRARKNPPGNRLLREYVVPKGKLPSNCTPAFKAKLEKAKKAVNKFHGPAKRIRVFEYDDGKKDVTDVVCFSLGEEEITIDVVEDKHGREIPLKEPLQIGSVYKAPKGSFKKGEQFVHSYREDGGKPPISAIDVDTGIKLSLGGTYTAFGKWLRK